MIDILKRIFKNDGAAGDQNKKKTSPHNIHIATCALLIEMANIDGEFSDSEKTDIISALKSSYNLSDEEVASILKTSEEELPQTS